MYLRLEAAVEAREERGRETGCVLHTTAAEGEPNLEDLLALLRFLFSPQTGYQLDEATRRYWTLDWAEVFDDFNVRHPASSCDSQGTVWSDDRSSFNAVGSLVWNRAYPAGAASGVSGMQEPPDAAPSGGTQAFVPQQDPAPPVRAAQKPVKVLDRVFHGTWSRYVDDLLKEGFKPGMSRNGKRFGDGFYFTESVQSARSWSADDMRVKGKGPVIAARISGSVAFIDQQKVEQTVKKGDFSEFPFIESAADESRLTELIKSVYAGSGVSESAIGIFLKEKGYSAMYLSPWREIVVFDSAHIVGMEKI
ncbi:hypothetical protein OG331_47390 [Streptomyces sp. NBC_01017]|uniref:hypothetical protein n=1 Tax=Streptomyces sp. NBC_01017 TaxID=2903721 RepID=UPI00386A7234|nr:hypothetical protein OG331_04600 [Streptomyces sp. NBC_01017]WSV34701.1 hypothetical protein OG331_47390 [Streptomyces sp. NBC_01017]